MSSGFFGFFAHCGVLTVLEEEGLLPERVSGSSAGALATSCWAAGLGARALADELLALRREDFWDPRPGPGLLAGRLFEDRLRRILPVGDFAECSIPVTISAYDVVRRRIHVLREGDLATAVRASCALPGLFHPVWREGALLTDGGVADRPGLSGLKGHDRVFYHHLASRSPWRRRKSRALRVPERSGMVALVIERLPRVGPFALHEGAGAFAVAQRATRLALEKEIDDIVQVPHCAWS